MINVEFVDRLPVQRAQRKDSTGQLHAEFSEALKARPGEWAKLPADLGGANPSVASGIRKGIGYKAYRGGQFQAHYINGQNYVRFIGGVQ